MSSKTVFFKLLASADITLSAEVMQQIDTIAPIGAFKGQTLV